MVAPRSTSRVFAAALAWRNRLRDDVTWTVGANQQVPQVDFMTSVEPGQNAELVQVAAQAESEIVWEQAPHGRRENVTLTTYVDVGTDIDGPAMMARLEELSSLVERSVYDDTVTDSFKPLIVGPGQDLEGLVGVGFEMVPRSGGVEQATFGRATITYLASFRI